MQTDQFNHDLATRVSVLEKGLSQLGQGIILLSKHREVMFVTDVAKDMVDKQDGLVVVNRLLNGVLNPDHARLKQMFDVVMQDDEAQNYRSFYIHRVNRKKPYILLMSKMCLRDSQDAPQEAVLVIIKDTHANAAYWQERLKTNFGLTKREADFVVLLTEGRNIKEISLVMDIAEDTTRQYLKNCFKKMEVNKQHELVCLALDSLRKR